MFEEIYTSKKDELKKKIDQHFQHTKMIKCLEKICDFQEYHHNEYVLLIKKCAENTWLDEKEAEFLVYLLDKYGKKEDYLFWAYQEIQAPTNTEGKKRYRKQPNPNELVFDYAQ